MYRRKFVPLLLVGVFLTTAGVIADPGEDLDACAQLFAAHPEAESSAECFYRVGSGSALESEAIRRMQELRARHPQNPWLSFYLGYLTWGDPEALELFCTAADLFATRGEVAGEVRARFNLHHILSSRVGLEEAGREVERAVQAAEAAAEPLPTARARILQAKHLYSLGGDLERANLLLREAESIVFPDGDYRLKRDCLLWLGSIQFEIGRRQAAKRVYRRYLDLAVAEGDRYGEANARYHLTRTLLEELAELPRGEEKEKITDLARQTLAAARASGHRTVAAKALLILGMLGHGEEARQYLDQCLTRAPNDQVKSYCLNGLARHLTAASPVEAQALTEEALGLAHQAGDPWSLVFSWRERMRLSWSVGPLERAIADSQSALDTIEALRRQQSDFENLAGLLATWSDDYYWLSGRLLEAYLNGRGRENLERAFGVTERLRARALIDALEAARAEVRSESGGSHLGETRFATLAQVRRSLTGEEALISFQVAPWTDVTNDFAGGSWLLASTREATRVYRLPDRVELRPKVRLFNGLFQRRDGKEVGPSVALYQELLGAAMDDLPAAIERLIIIADDRLHLLPFSALRASPEAVPMAARYQLSLVPSATLWQRWRERRPSPPEVLALAFADPRPLDSAAARRRTVERGGVDAEMPRLGALPHARREGRAMVAHLGGGSLLRVGEDASEHFLKHADLSRFGILHFATHAVTDYEFPRRSAVILTPGSEAEDGRLQIREIVELDLDGRIVVLSSCRSASGTVLRGEGVMGLARAFFQAGAHTVVASLWPLQDQDAEQLFHHFYRYLGEGRSVAAALRAAQCERMAAGAPAAAWAGLVVLGDGELVPAPGGTPPRFRPTGWRLALVAGVIFALLLFGSLYLHRRGSPA